MDPFTEAARGTVVGVFALTLCVAVAWRFRPSVSRVALAIALAIPFEFGLSLLLGFPKLPPEASDDRVGLMVGGAAVLAWTISCIQPHWGRILAAVIGAGAVMWFIVWPRASVALEYEQWTSGQAVLRIAVSVLALAIGVLGGYALGRTSNTRSPWPAVLLAPMALVATGASGLTGSLKGAQSASLIVAACCAWVIAAMWAPVLRRGAGTASGWATLMLMVITLNSVFFAETPLAVPLLIALIPWAALLGTVIYRRDWNPWKSWAIGLGTGALIGVITLFIAAAPMLFAEQESSDDTDLYESYDSYGSPGG